MRVLQITGDFVVIKNYITSLRIGHSVLGLARNCHDDAADHKSAPD